MPRRFQFSLKALLILMLAVACFFGGIRFERERRRREDEAALAGRLLPYLKQEQVFPPSTKWARNKEGRLLPIP
jgi:hypothetical protein